MAPAPLPSQSALLRVVDQVAPAELHEALWASCTSPRWSYSNRSHDADHLPFWKMDLTGDPAADALWQHVRPAYEQLVGAPLTVLRQYANAHTFGQGGKAHRDDVRPGTYTLLYYPMPSWPASWEGETVFYDAQDEIVLSVRPRPNRAVLFDARIPHAGRPPARPTTDLRVTVAYKLAATGSTAGS